MTDRVNVDWELDQDDVVLTIQLRMSGEQFIERARQIYHALNPLHRRPADRLLDADSRKNDTGS